MDGKFASCIRSRAVSKDFGSLNRSARSTNVHDRQIEKSQTCRDKSSCQVVSLADHVNRTRDALGCTVSRTSQMPRDVVDSFLNRMPINKRVAGKIMNKQKGASSQKPLGLFMVAMIMFGITTTLHGLSPLATYGWGSIFFLLVASIGFLLPAGLVSAELATCFQREGGVYVWVSEAFGTDWGFLATWLQWLQNLFFWTVILTGSATMLALGLGWEAGVEDKAYIAAVVVGVIWLCTGLTYCGLGFTGGIGTLGSLAGTIFPGLILIGLATAYLASGQSALNHWHWDRLIPDFSKPSTLSFGISTIMIFAGVELMGTRVSRMRDPGRVYPAATMIAITLTVLLLIPVVLAIAVLVPAEEINLSAGLLQAVKVVSSEHAALSWLPVIFAIALMLDSIGEIAGWMAGTPIAMAAAGRDGYLPKSLGSIRQDIAPGMLFTQAVLGSLVSVTFLVVPGVQSVFWILSALLVQLYVLMYILLFAAAWYLRRSQPSQHRPFRVPGGGLGMTLVCLLGLVLSLLVLVAGFIRPSGLHEISEIRYLVTISFGMTISLAPPLILIIYRRIGNKTSIKGEHG